MIQPDNLIRLYSGSSPLFVLPDFVLFPKTGHQFRIFEQRYIDMVGHAIEHEKFITLSLLKDGWKENYEGSPHIHEIGTLSYIVDYKKLANGEYSILLLGLSKVQINEAEQTHPYRICATTFLNEITNLFGEDEKKKLLIKQFEKLLQIVDEDVSIQVFNNPEFSLEIMINMICVMIPIPAIEKQKMLELQDINLRYEILIHFINAEISAEREGQQILPVLPITQLMD